MGVVTGFIRSAGRMEEQIFVPRWVLRASFAERLKPLTTKHGTGILPCCYYKLLRHVQGLIAACS